MLWNQSPQESDFIISSTDQPQSSTKKRKVETTIVNIKPFAIIESHSNAVSSIAIGNGILYSGSWDHTIKQFDIETQSNTVTLNCEKVVLSLGLSENMLATGHVDDCVRVWDIRQRGNNKLIIINL